MGGFGKWAGENPVLALVFGLALLLSFPIGLPPLIKLIQTWRGKNGDGHGNGDTSVVVGNGTGNGTGSGPQPAVVDFSQFVRRDELEALVNKDELKAETGPIHWELGMLSTQVGEMARKVDKHREEQVEMRTESRLSNAAILAALAEIRTGQTAVEKGLASDLFNGMRRMKDDVLKAVDEKLGSGR